MLFGWPASRDVRPGWPDLSLLAWCSVPATSALANGPVLVEGLAQSRYLVVIWGILYLMGRAYLADADALRRLALGFVNGGLLYAPACLIELVHGPFLYKLLYGAYPYQWEESIRFLGFRPLVFQEHGDQLGM